jgi:hypothetical protein
MGAGSMGGSGSGPRSGRAVVESGLRLDIDELIRRKAIQPGKHLGGEIAFPLDDDKLVIQFESSALHPLHSWLRLKYTVTDWTGEQHDIDDKVYLAATRLRGRATPSGDGARRLPPC